MQYRQPLLLGLAMVVASSAEAHEFWIEPPARVVASGESMALRLYAGDGFPGESYARNPDHVERFELVGPGGSLAIEGTPGDDPAGRVRVSRTGTHIVVYRSSHSRVELPAETFNTYLAGEGLEHSLELREHLGELAAPGRERYSRCAKSIVAVGEPGSGGHDRPVGLELELVPETDPLLLVPGDELTVRVLLRGKPSAGLLLHAFRRGHPGAVQQARTDAQGRATLRLDSTGVWLISGVQMSERRDVLADWESLWASLTFIVGDPRQAPGSIEPLRTEVSVSHTSTRSTTQTTQGEDE